MRQIRKKQYKIYIVLTFSKTLLSRVIKGYTKAEFAHVSLSLDDRLDMMYSFGRLNSYIPFWGGFVKEDINYGFFKRFNDTKSAIFSINVSEKQYKHIKKIIRKMNENKKNYKFNVLGLFMARFNIERKKNNAFYCSEFVKYVMNKAYIQLDLPKITKPMDFFYHQKLNLEYEGLLRDYNK